jgi:hypothetical protein
MFSNQLESLEIMDNFPNVHDQEKFNQEDKNLSSKFITSNEIEVLI